MTTEERQRRAIERAPARGGAAVVQPGRYPDTYQVGSISREGLTHSVSVEGGVWRCSCESGLAHKPCWHQAAVYLWQVEQGGARVIGPVALAA